MNSWKERLCLDNENNTKISNFVSIVKQKTKFIFFFRKKMEIFVSNQVYFATLGIVRHQTTVSFNARILSSCLIMCLSLVSYGGFLIFVANNFKQYTESIYFTSVIASVTVIFLTFVWNIKNFFSFVDEWKDFVAQS